MDYTTIRIRTKDYQKLKFLADKDERTIIWYMSKLLKEELNHEQIRRGAARSNSSSMTRHTVNKPVKKKVHPLFGTLKQIWLDTWKQNNKYDFLSWGAAHSVALNQIIIKIETQLLTSTDMIGNGETQQVFQIIMDKLPQFYKDKFLTAINKNYDTIIADITNGGNKGKQIQNGGKLDFRN